MKEKIIRIISLLLALLCAGGLLTACRKDDPDAQSSGSLTSEISEKASELPYDPTASRYNEKALWSFCEYDRSEKVDTFFVAPTAAAGDFNNMPTDDPEIVEKYNLQVGNQKGIYDDSSRFFAPVYAQMTLQCYALSDEERQPYADLAYADVKEAFTYYLNCWNGGNAIILAGSSQGSEMILRLLRDFFPEIVPAERLVGCYAIGWKITEEDMAGLGAIHFATGESDLQAVISFNSELPEISESLIVGKDEKTLCINPLNWKTTGEEAPAESNLGCCIYSTKGYQKGDDLTGFCGAYIDPARGTLKVTGMAEQDPDGSLYPSRIDGQPYGVFHIYDWEFFYRNLEKNVQTRIAEYLK